MRRRSSWLRAPARSRWSPARRRSAATVARPLALPPRWPGSSTWSATGGRANFFEGAGAAPTLTNTASAGRNACRLSGHGQQLRRLLPAHASRSAELREPVRRRATGPRRRPTRSPTGSANPPLRSAGGADDAQRHRHAGCEPDEHRDLGRGRPDLDRRVGHHAFLDDGVGPDAAAGDNVFTYRATVPPTTTPGTKLLDVTARDAQSRSGSTTIALLVESPPPPLIAIQHDPGRRAHLAAASAQLVATHGIVTGKIGTSFYIQDPDPDARRGHVGGDPGLRRDRDERGLRRPARHGAGPRDRVPRERVGRT